MVTARVARAVGAALALMAAWPDAPTRAESGGSGAAFAQADRERMEASAILARAAQALDAATAAVGARRAEAHEVDTAREDAAVLLQAQRAAMATALAVTGGKPGDARAQLVIAQLIRTAATQKVMPAHCAAERAVQCVIILHGSLARPHDVGAEFGEKLALLAILQQQDERSFAGYLAIAEIKIAHPRQRTDFRRVLRQPQQQARFAIASEYPEEVVSPIW